jgi:hypothetical protein
MGLEGLEDMCRSLISGVGVEIEREFVPLSLVIASSMKKHCNGVEIFQTTGI